MSAVLDVIDQNLIFDRRARLVIAPPPPLGSKAKTAPIIDITDLQMAWHFHKSWKWQPNAGWFLVSNLNEESRAQIQGRGVKCTFYAGHGDEMGIVGSIDGRADHVKEPTDWRLKIEGSDGGRGFQYAELTKAWAGKTPTLDVVNDLVNAMGMDFTGDSLALVQSRLSGKVFKQGYTNNLTVRRSLRSILGNYGMWWSIQDGQVQVFAKDGLSSFVPIEETIILSPETGLIGSPAYSSPPHPGKPQLVKAEHVFIPTAKVGVKVELHSRQRSGLHKVWEFTHSGDTHGSDCKTTFLLQALKAGK